MYCTTIQLGVTISPLIFLFQGKTPQICFQTIVDNFHLSISLGMISDYEMQLGSV
jgi:hypothetical protein